MNEILKQNRFRVEGMDCASCATKIDTAVRRVSGVEDVSVSVTTGMMTVRHDGSSDLESVAKRSVVLAMASNHWLTKSACQA